jgi:hypothetical protein
LVANPYTESSESGFRQANPYRELGESDFVFSALTLNPSPSRKRDKYPRDFDECNYKNYSAIFDT